MTQGNPQLTNISWVWVSEKKVLTVVTEVTEVTVMTVLKGVIDVNLEKSTGSAYR